MKLRGLVLFLVAASLLWGLQGCVYSGGSIATSTAVDATQALQTVQFILTSTSPAQESTVVTPVSTSDSITPSPSAASTVSVSATPSGSPVATLMCDLAAAGSPIDVTIPDDTVLQPGQAFTKIWKLENAGSCTWSKDYAAVFFYGDMLGAMDVTPIAAYVEPGQSIEIAIEMIAPAAPGSYQGNWMLRNTDGVMFGIGPAGSSPFWVRIIVAEPVRGSPTPTRLPTFTPTPTETLTPTPQPTATPPVAAQSQLSLDTDYLLDLDLAQVNPVQGADLAYRTGSVGYHWLIPQGQTILGVYGEQLPGLQDCQSASMSAAPIAVESLAPGLYLCYRTTQGQAGWLQLLTFDDQTFAISLEMLTWTTP